MFRDRLNKFKSNSYVVNSNRNDLNCSNLSRSSGVEARNSAFDSYLDVGAYHIPLENTKPDVENHATNTVRALADIFTCKVTNFPLTIGIFSQQNNKEYLSQLANELYNLNRLEYPLTLKFSKLLFLFPLVISTILGYIIGMLTNWQIGLSIGHIVMFIQITILAIIIIGSRFCHKPMAIRASYCIAYFLQWIKLLLSICFCYPTKTVNSKAPVRTIVVYHRLWPSSTTKLAFFALIEKMWFYLIKHYGQLLIRLERTNKVTNYTNQKFKKICCLPSFIVMLAFWITFLISTSIIRIYSGELAKLLGHSGPLSIFVIMTSIMFLSFFGSLPSLLKIIYGLLNNPIKSIKLALTEFIDTENYDNKIRITHSRINEKSILNNSTSFKNLAITDEEQRACKADLFIKSEFSKICNLSLTFDRFTHTQQTRFILCLDASETTQRDILAKIIYQIHNLILSNLNAPVAIILEANFQILLGDMICGALLSPRIGFSNVIVQDSKYIAQTLIDNFHLVHTSLHLPIYLESPIFTDLEDKIDNSKQTTTQSNHSPNEYSNPLTNLNDNNCNNNNNGKPNINMTVISSNYESTNNPVTTKISPVLFDHNIYTTYTNKQNWSKITPLLKNLQTNNSFNLCNKYLNLQEITNLFLNNNELAEWNNKILKQLTICTSFTSRLLRLCNIEMDLNLVVLWIMLVQYWPYHIAWLISYLEELNTSNTSSVNKVNTNQIMINLMEAFIEVKRRVACSIERLEPLATEDRDLEKLHKILSTKCIKPISLINLKCLISCTLVQNPFLRIVIQTLDPQANDRHASGAHISFISPLDALIEERSDQIEYGSALSKSTQPNSGPIYASINTINSRTLPNHLIQPTSESLSSVENIQSNNLWPCSTDTITASENFVKKFNSSLTKKKYPPIPLNQFTVNDVCELFSSIPNIPAANMQVYMSKIRQLNISGLILSVCDLEKLRQELMINPADWKLFHKTISHLRSEEIKPIPPVTRGLRNRSPSVNYEASESVATVDSSLFRSRNLPNKSPHESLPLITYDSKFQSNTNLKMNGAQFFVRQTPWLLSPHLPVTTVAGETTMELIHDLTCKDHLSTGSTDQQNSCSGMEEPESLYKAKLDPKTDMIVKNQHYFDKPGTQEIFNQCKNSCQIPILEENNSKLSTRSLLEHTREDQFNLNKHKNERKPEIPSGRHRNMNFNHSNNCIIKNAYNSRSSVDLRTAFGPEQQNIIHNSQLIALRNSNSTKRNRIKKAMVQRKSLFSYPTFSSSNKPELFDPNKLFCSTNICNNDKFKLTNSKRIIRQPHRRFTSQTNNRKDSLTNKSNILYNEPINSIETDTDQTNQSMDNHSPQSVKHEKYYWNQMNYVDLNKSHILPTPALTPAQLASLQTYTTWSNKFSPLYPNPSMLINPGLNDPNSYWTNYFQITNNHLNNIKNQLNNNNNNKIHYHTSGHSGSSRPSQKKRARKYYPENQYSFVIKNNHSNIGFKPIDLNLTNEHINQNNFSVSNNNNNNINNNNNNNNSINQNQINRFYEPDSEMELCTCDYWYEFDRNKGIFTISEPSLRAESNHSSSDNEYHIHDDESQSSSDEKN